MAEENMVDEAGMHLHGSYNVTEATSTNKDAKSGENDFERFGVFMGKHPKGFKASIRWSAQKEMIRRVMVDQIYEQTAGILEARQAIAASIRIAAQTEIRRLMYEKSCVKKDRNQVEALERLTDEDIEAIKNYMIDWQYDVKPREDTESKQREKAQSFLDKMDPAERKAFLAKYV